MPGPVRLGKAPAIPAPVADGSPAPESGGRVEWQVIPNRSGREFRGVPLTLRQDRRGGGEAGPGTPGVAVPSPFVGLPPPETAQLILAHREKGNSILQDPTRSAESQCRIKCNDIIPTLHDPPSPKGFKLFCSCHLDLFIQMNNFRSRVTARRLCFKGCP